MKNSFKDQCDICKKFDYLKTINNKCLCKECFKKETMYKGMKMGKEYTLEELDL